MLPVWTGYSVINNNEGSFRPLIYVCHIDHEHDRTYTENLVEYFENVRVRCNVIEFHAPGQCRELELAFDDQPTAVLGYNAELDHCWLPSGNFVTTAASRGVPVIQWILDHPSARWPQFENAPDSCFLFNTKHAEQYFHRYCMPGALTATMGGVGPNKRTHIAALSTSSFRRRPFRCLIALSLKRVGGTVEETWAAIDRLEAPLATAIKEAVAAASFDLSGPLDAHLALALERSSQVLDAQRFSSCFFLVDEAVQGFRRTKILDVARHYPVLVQSDPSAVAYFANGQATCLTNVSMQSTLARMPLCRAVLSVSPLNDMIHDRAMNALNAGCVAIVEDNPAHRAILEHQKSALFFRYDDDSLRDCFEIVCNEPERAYAIAREGMKVRNDPRVRFGEFDNIILLARDRLNQLELRSAKIGRA